MLNLANTTATTSYVDPTSLLIECDRWEEMELNDREVKLIRLEYASRFDGIVLSSDDLLTIKTLRENLNLKSEKRVTIAEARTWGVAILSNTLGPYFTRITVPFSIYNHTEVNKLWDTNPIVACEVAMIPPDAKPIDLQSNRLQRADVVTFQFRDTGFTPAFGLLLGLHLNCRVLELRNVQVAQASILQNRLKHTYPNLQRVITHVPDLR